MPIITSHAVISPLTDPLCVQRTFAQGLDRHAGDDFVELVAWDGRDGEDRLIVARLIFPRIQYMLAIERLRLVPLDGGLH